MKKTTRKKKKRSGPAPIIRGGRILIRQNHNGRWHWTFFVNGSAMVRSASDYTRARQAVRAWERFKTYARRHQTVNRAAGLGLP